MRERLPNRRPSSTFTLMWPPDRPSPYDISIGTRDAGDAQPREVFVTSYKANTALDIVGRDLATLISIALQHGATIEELAGAVCRDESGAPQGLAGAVLDAVKSEAL